MDMNEYKYCYSCGNKVYKNALMCPGCKVQFVDNENIMGMSVKRVFALSAILGCLATILGAIYIYMELNPPYVGAQVAVMREYGDLEGLKTYNQYELLHSIMGYASMLIGVVCLVLLGIGIFNKYARR